ncbi:MAG: PspC domain-containing protein [Bacteroidales bacterium]|nr:PspC domain-containing protein [Bacteroidales bacterium]
MSLHKSADKVIGGVCGGIAESLNLDKTLVRLIYVLLTIGTAFSGVLIYLLLWLIMPEQ